MEWNEPTHSPSPMSLYPHHYHWQYHRQYQYVGNIVRISIDSIANRTRHIITSSFKLWRAEQTIANLKGKTNIGFEKTRSRRWQSHSIFEKETEDCEKRNRKRLDSTRLDSTQGTEKKESGTLTRRVLSSNDRNICCPAREGTRSSHEEDHEKEAIGLSTLDRDNLHHHRHHHHHHAHRQHSMKIVLLSTVCVDVVVLLVLIRTGPVVSTL